MFLNDVLVYGDRVRNQVGTRIIPDKKLLGVKCSLAKKLVLPRG